MNAREMPKYQSHKQVWALKIGTITVLDNGDAEIVPVNDKYGIICVSKEYVEKHQPESGGYYVMYKGGYESWSPADAFESGYTLVEELDQSKSDPSRLLLTHKIPDQEVRSTSLVYASKLNHSTAEGLVSDAKIIYDYLK